MKKILFIGVCCLVIGAQSVFAQDFLRMIAESAEGLLMDGTMKQDGYDIVHYDPASGQTSRSTAQVDTSGKNVLFTNQNQDITATTELKEGQMKMNIADMGGNMRMFFDSQTKSMRTVFFDPATKKELYSVVAAEGSAKYYKEGKLFAESFGDNPDNLIVRDQKIYDEFLKLSQNAE